MNAEKRTTLSASSVPLSTLPHEKIFSPLLRQSVFTWPKEAMVIIITARNEIYTFINQNLMSHPYKIIDTTFVSPLCFIADSM
jgi:hypothetical protein